MQTLLELNPVFYDLQDVEAARTAFASQFASRASITIEPVSPANSYIRVHFVVEPPNYTIALEFANAVLHYRQNR